ncbi:hypothetical protein [Flavobacterium algicola]|uniref:hypothetical protein n=1 Tax=Flavobacterium algicola TaxID=556529 RepID=UPI001EFD2C39|nr:hypothetical protein [Flavobacterium algicola]MCG9793660.1 hypothetical protein [Flavobacterium algicola]
MKHIKINIDKIDLELAQLLWKYPNRLLATDERLKLYEKFGKLLQFNFSENSIIYNDQLLAMPHLVYLVGQARKFNQRTGFYTSQYCPIVEEDRPINNVNTKVIVINNEVKIVDKKEYPNFLFYLEFADYDKYKGNAIYFVEIYKEIILKSSIFLDPYYKSK